MIDKETNKANRKKGRAKKSTGLLFPNPSHLSPMNFQLYKLSTL